ncbi:uncharacterized protein N7500_006064 [Penicillium coprophilum]|uniref:uncharacterized protein n=1 Tax=Penicillium coprophilum TaxID=36646 RepID=UPI002390EC4B|nr:uncharacterized protein N7500_006064 [Penicillium coprophilum]KAJ5164234.1 hypothetical protein N7500_006064 [Penicillium coprophilum]
MAGRETNRCPFMVGSERLVDPEDDIALWVTVEFPEAMKFTHSDEQLMEFVVQQVQNHNTSISTSAQHYRRHFCLSLPVVGYPRDEEHIDTVMALAETLALWWLGEIHAHKVHIDRNVIFP